MKFTDLFIQRPVLASVVSLLILVLGLRSLVSLKVSEYPQTENAVVTISTAYYGANADTIAGFITQPLEAAVAQAQGIDYLSSSSSTGVSTITATLRLTTDAMYMGFYSDVLPSNNVTDYLLRVVKPKLDSIEGVQTAEILGGRQFAMRAWLDSTRMAAHGVTAADVYTALGNNNYLATLGTTKGQMVSFDDTASTEL